MKRKTEYLPHWQGQGEAQNTKHKTQSTKLIVALDLDSPDKINRLVDKLSPVVKLFKIGATAFVGLGPEIVKGIQDKGAQIFLDLKFHDIPNTVAGASRMVVRLGVAMFTLHAQGGKQMMQAAFAAVKDEAKRLKIRRPLMFGVTVLTSQEDRHTKVRVLELARDVKEAGLDGVVCSVCEAPLIHKAFGEDLLTVCAGIRPRGSQAGDQKRVATPQAAKAAGVDFVVVGRPITLAKNPLQEARKILRQLG